MCGIAGILDTTYKTIDNLKKYLNVMNKLQEHRGPDGEGVWVHGKGLIGMAHRRLSIIDIDAGQQPMGHPNGNWIVFNGEIYNYNELRIEIGVEEFKTHSDTEVILKAYEKWGTDCLSRFIGMFAFALWDEKNQLLFCARDRFGIKPFYFMNRDGRFYFSSEIKALLPFAEKIETDLEALSDYLSFQFCLDGKTLFKNVKELLPGHYMIIGNGRQIITRYWQVYYQLDFDHTAKYFEEKIKELLLKSVEYHRVSDVPLGGYISGGLDSSIVASVAANDNPESFIGFTGKFSEGPEYDESVYAEALAKWRGFQLKQATITVDDFISNIEKVIYHLDFPVAGPGSLPQYMVSQLASKYRKVVLGGQGGDEIFGGYTRYLVAYFEQCIKAAIDGTMHNGNFIVTYESIIPNLTALRNYKPMLQEFWSMGLFESSDKRYFKLINRAPQLGEEIRWDYLKGYSPFDTFIKIFKAPNVKNESYFDSMTHFDFKTLLPALLQVEDRVSMAHGIESRVPFLYHPLVEFAATIPSNVKFKDGTMKECLKKSMSNYLPDLIKNRKDKMGFPVPLNQWLKNEAKEFAYDIFSSRKALDRELFDNRIVLDKINKESKFGRNIWALLSLELWQRAFHDKESKFKSMIN